MTRTQVEADIAALLVTDTGLRSIWVQAPHVTHIPFMGTVDQFYVLVSPCFQMGQIEMGEIVQSCIRIIHLLAESTLLSGTRGLEIMPCLIDGNATKRVLRLSIKREALDQALELVPPDFLSAKPSEGITCGWYFLKPEKL